MGSRVHILNLAVYVKFIVFLSPNYTIGVFWVMLFAFLVELDYFIWKCVERFGFQWPPTFYGLSSTKPSKWLLGVISNRNLQNHLCTNIPFIMYFHFHCSNYYVFNLKRTFTYSLKTLWTRACQWSITPLSCVPFSLMQCSIYIPGSHTGVHSNLNMLNSLLKC